MLRYRKKLETKINAKIDAEVKLARDQIAAEAQAAVKKITEGIAPTVIDVTESFLTSNLAEVKTLSLQNLQMFQSTVQTANAMYSNMKALIRIFAQQTEIPIARLEYDIQRVAFQYQVEMAYKDLIEKAHNAPAQIVEQFRSRIGQLYEMARLNGLETEYHNGAAKYTRDQQEKITDQEGEHE